MPDDEYIRRKRAKIAGNFGDTFLGWERLKTSLSQYVSEEISKSEARVLPTRASLLIGGAALLLVLVQLAGTYLVAVDPYHWIGRNWDDMATKSQVSSVSSGTAKALAQAQRAEREVAVLRAQVSRQVVALAHLRSSRRGRLLQGECTGGSACDFQGIHRRCQTLLVREWS